MQGYGRFHLYAFSCNSHWAVKESLREHPTVRKYVQSYLRNTVILFWMHQVLVTWGRSFSLNCFFNGFRGERIQDRSKIKWRKRKLWFYYKGLDLCVSITISFSFHLNVNLLYDHALICYLVKLKQILSKFNMFILTLAVFCVQIYLLHAYVSVVSGTFKGFIYKLNIVLWMFYFFSHNCMPYDLNFVFSGVLSLNIQTWPLIH